MKEKKIIIRENLILVIEGRAFLLFCIAFIIFLLVIFTRFLIIDCTLEKFMCLAFLIFIILPLLCFVLYHLWYRCFGKIIISDNCIEWRCIFMKSHKLSFDKCKYAGIQIFWKDNVVKYDIYNTGFAFIYVSTKPYPSEYEGRIDKLRCTDEFIKFPRSVRICECLATCLPDPQNRMFIEFTKISQRRKRRLEREKEKKKRK